MSEFDSPMPSVSLAGDTDGTEAFIPLKENEIKYDFDNKKQILTINFPLHNPPVKYVKPYQVAVRLWETIKSTNDHN